MCRSRGRERGVQFIPTGSCISYQLPGTQNGRNDAVGVVEPTGGGAFSGPATQRGLVGGVTHEVGVSLRGGVIGVSGGEAEVHGVILHDLKKPHKRKDWREREMIGKK